MYKRNKIKSIYPWYYDREKTKEIGQEYTINDLKVETLHALNLWSIFGDRLLKLVQAQAIEKGFSKEQVFDIEREQAMQSNWMKNSFIKNSKRFLNNLSSLE